MFILAFATITIFIILIVRKINSYRYPEPIYGKTNERDRNDYPIKDYLGEIKLIDDGSVQGFHMVPKNKSSKGVVVVFGGSEGSANYDTAYGLYKEGYEVLALYFFGQKNQPKILSLVDISFFREVEEYIGKDKLSNESLTVMGISKGAELALLLTQYFSSIDNVILFAPSAYTFEGLNYTSEESSWVYLGKVIPYCKFSKSIRGKLSMIGANIFNYPVSYINLYSGAAKGVSTKDSEWILKNEFQGNMVMFAGNDDKMWNSAEMGKKIQKIYPNCVKLHIFTKAGHAFVPYTYADRMMFGGTKEVNEKAKVKSDKLLLEYLKKWHY